MHAVRRLVADATPFAKPAWRQTGFWNSTGPDGQPVTGRNLFGQVDGTGNPAVGTPEFDSDGVDRPTAARPSSYGGSS